MVLCYVIDSGLSTSLLLLATLIIMFYIYIYIMIMVIIIIINTILRRNCCILCPFCCRYLATGDAQQTISFSYRLGKTTVCHAIRETCDAIWNVLHDETIITPTTEDEWKAVARDFYKLWNFPHCLGALDGKHVVIQAPPKSGSAYYNYKGTFSVVLMALCNAEYCFTMVDIGAPGRESDGGVYSQTTFANLLESGSLSIPPATTLPSSSVSAPYVVVADAAFPLKTNMIKPYPGKNLSLTKEASCFHCSWARRVIENTFGILSARWRIFRRPIVALPENAIRATKAACVLHNFLQRRNDASDAGERFYCPAGFADTYDDNGVIVPGQWRSETLGTTLDSLQSITGNRSSRSAQNVRDTFVDFFVSPVGEVQWQYGRVNSVGPTVD